MWMREQEEYCNDGWMFLNKCPTRMCMAKVEKKEEKKEFKWNLQPPDNALMIKWRDRPIRKLLCQLWLLCMCCVYVSGWAGSDEKDVEWSVLVYLVTELVGFHFSLGSVYFFNPVVLHCALQVHIRCQSFIYKCYFSFTSHYKKWGTQKLILHCGVTLRINSKSLWTHREWKVNIANRLHSSSSFV